MTYNEQTKPKIDAWIAELPLRKQTNFRLKEGDNFCCLGVMCDLFNPSGWNDLDGFSTRPTRLPKFGVPPEEVTKEFGLTVYDAICLSFLNDSGLTFQQIADILLLMTTDASMTVYEASHSLRRTDLEGRPTK